MTNIYGSPEKVTRKSRLFQIGLDALHKHGWLVERVPGGGKSSLRKITKNGKSQLVSIRTTQDTSIAFPRTQDDKGWVTLSEVGAVLAVSVDDPHNPRCAKVHMLPGDEMRDRFDRAYAARRKAGHVIPVGRGVWLALYFKEASEPASYVGAGAGLKYPPIEVVPLALGDLSEPEVPISDEAPFHQPDEASLTIAEAKRRLALTFGVDPSSIKITVEA
jgi:hypothetical protein